MNNACIFEHPNGKFIEMQSENDAELILAIPMSDWDLSPNGESCLMHVALNKEHSHDKAYSINIDGTMYDVVSNNDVINIRRPEIGKMYLCCDEMCACDNAQVDGVIIGTCGGNPFPIHRSFMIEDQKALYVIKDFIKYRKLSGICEWKRHSDMPIDWEKYV